MELFYKWNEKTGMKEENEMQRKIDKKKTKLYPRLCLTEDGLGEARRELRWNAVALET